MARKTAASKKSTDPDLWDSAQKIWMAGLGALAIAEEEGGKLFDSLVDQGHRYQDTVRGDLDRAKSSVETALRDVKSRTGKTLERVEAALDDRVSSALGRIGVPRSDELARLSERVEKLTRTLDALQSGKRTRRKTAAGTAKKKAAKKKTAKKKAAASGGRKKTAAKATRARKKTASR